MLNSVTLSAPRNIPTSREIQSQAIFPSEQLGFWNAKTRDSAADYKMPILDKSLEAVYRLFFDICADQWIAETKWQSSISAITGHRMFSEIKSMGDNAIGPILKRMKSGDVQIHWFPLLFDLVGHDPVPAHKRGLINEMALEWIEWGEKTGRI